MGICSEPAGTSLIILLLDLRGMKDKDFFKDYEAHQNETIDDYIARHSGTEQDLRDVISFLIHHREMIRDAELEVLEHETEQLIEKLADTKRKILLEELQCFKDVLRLHKRLLSQDDEPGD